MSSGEIDSLSIVSPGDASCIASGSKDHAELEYNDVEKNQSALCEEVIAPSHAVESLERWNSSNTIRYRYFVTLLDMFVLGMNDAAIGALVPYVSDYGQSLPKKMLTTTARVILCTILYNRL